MLRRAGQVDDETRGAGGRMSETHAGDEHALQRVHRGGDAVADGGIAEVKDDAVGVGDPVAVEEHLAIHFDHDAIAARQYLA